MASSRADSLGVLVEIPGSPDDGGFELWPDDRRHPQGLVGGVRETGQAPADDFPDPFGNDDLVDRETRAPPAVPPSDATRFGEVADDLPHEEGIALRFSVNDPGQGEAFVVQVVTSRTGWSEEAAASQAATASKRR
jgi:hypothetical protein